MKNTYIISHQGKTYTSHNILLNSYKELINQGLKVTDYIAFGNGTGTPAVGNYSLFSKLGARLAQVVEYNTDCQNGDYYVLRKIVLGADEFLGQTITEIGFCANLDGSLITHSVLDNGVVKGNEPMEITALFYIPKLSGFLEGDNPLIKVLLGIDALDYGAFAYGNCDYYSIADAENIIERMPCIHNQNQSLKLICPNPITEQRNIVLFYNNQPIIAAKRTYQKVISTSYNYTVDNKGLVLIEDFYRKTVAAISIDQSSAVCSIQSKISSVSEKTYTKALRSQDQKIFVSKDRQYLIIVQDSEMEVYKDFEGCLSYFGKINFKTRISFLDVCAGKIAVVCNRRDTPLCTNTTRLHFFDLTSGQKITQKPFQNDLSCDIESLSLEYAGADNMVLYYLSNGTLAGHTFCYTDPNPVLIDNYSVNVSGAKFLGTSYRRNTVFTDSLIKDDLGGTVHQALLDGENNPLYSGIILNLKAISPDQMYYNGEAITAYSEEAKTMSVYSYVNQTLRVFSLFNYVTDIGKVFLDGRYIVITSADNAFFVFETDYDLCQLRLITSGITPAPSAEQVFIMNDLIVFKNGNMLTLSPIVYDDINIYSDQSAYFSSVFLRLANIQYGSETGYDSFSIALSFTY